MSGIYIHIPFCKQACHYCDFHFSTSLKKKEEMLRALHSELILRASELGEEEVATIYFGGGTPSVLETEEINRLVDTVNKNYKVITHPEITLEANPDDLSSEKLKQLAASKINRLSIGVQSFFEEDLVLMNRAHNAQQAENCLAEATQYFSNISIDLIYGIPEMSMARWKQNIEKALSFNLVHISSYALTVEPKTALHKMVHKGQVKAPSEALAQEHFTELVHTLAAHGYVHYEISNFGKPNFFSKNNTAYWQGKKYLGIGPSAHSFNGTSRSWNIANNIKYITAITQGRLPKEVEHLSLEDRYNEYVMTGLRTIWGVSLPFITNTFGERFYQHILKEADKHLTHQLVEIKEDVLKVTAKGKFLCDGIASDLFIL